MKSLFPKIHIEQGIFRRTPDFVRNFGGRFAIITDGNLKREGEDLLARMRKSGLGCNLLVVPASEKSKSLSMAEKISISLVKLGIRRDGCILALGGGVIGDLAGFTASIFMRGIPYVSIPTTVLAMADSSIGGKTGVNLESGKNLLGTFYHSKMILMDPNLLKNLSQRAFTAGLSEIIKHGIIANSKLFFYMERNASAILARRPAALKHIIRESVKVKLAIVKKDERESVEKKSGTSRMLLNYGHTVGHALEKISNYSMPHGEAVAIGMIAENRIAVGKKFLSEKDAARIDKALTAFHLPTKIPADYSTNAIKAAISADKKNIGGAIYFALPIQIGKAQIHKL